MPTRKKPLTSKGLGTLLQAMNLRQDIAMTHQNDLFSRSERADERLLALEKAAKQSPSDRCLFARVTEIERRLDEHNRKIEARAAPRSMWSLLPPPRPARSAREIYLENHCAWLQAELARYTRS